MKGEYNKKRDEKRRKSKKEERPRHQVRILTHSR